MMWLVVKPVQWSTSLCVIDLSNYLSLISDANLNSSSQIDVIGVSHLGFCSIWSKDGCHMTCVISITFYNLTTLTVKYLTIGYISFHYFSKGSYIGLHVVLETCFRSMRAVKLNWMLLILLSLRCLTERRSVDYLLSKHLSCCESEFTFTRWRFRWGEESWQLCFLVLFECLPSTELNNDIGRLQRACVNYILSYAETICVDVSVNGRLSARWWFGNLSSVSPMWAGIGSSSPVQVKIITGWKDMLRLVCSRCNSRNIWSGTGDQQKATTEKKSRG